MPEKRKSAMGSPYSRQGQSATVIRVEILTIVGPTGTGKSTLALELAEALPGEVEIINADAFAQYRGMDIGTAKVTPNERRGIPHHLIDILDPLEDSSIADFQVAGRQVIEQVRQRGALPLVVGGSGLYVRALLEELDIPPVDEAVRKKLELELEEFGLPSLHQRLQQLDPTAAANIGTTNARRIVRALEVITITGKPFTAKLPEQKYWLETQVIGLQYPRPVLDARIAARTQHMQEAGLLAEVERLASPKQGGSGVGLGTTAARAIGYAELLPVLQGDDDEQSAFQNIETHTRQLTRKQMTWFGRDPRIKWFSGTDPDVKTQILENINPDFG
jgi:tRNA dimethylallyltransferase